MWDAPSSVQPEQGRFFLSAGDRNPEVIGVLSQPHDAGCRARSQDLRNLRFAELRCLHIAVITGHPFNRRSDRSMTDMQSTG